MTYTAKAREIAEDLAKGIVNLDQTQIERAFQKLADEAYAVGYGKGKSEGWLSIEGAKENTRYLVCNPAEGDLIVMAMRRGSNWRDFAGRAVEPTPTYYREAALPLPPKGK